MGGWETQYTNNVRERLSYHLRHSRQWERITLSLLICSLRLSFPCRKLPSLLPLTLSSFSFNIHLSLPAIDTFHPPFLFPLYLIFFSSLLPLSSDFLYLFLSWASLCPSLTLQLHLHSISLLFVSFLYPSPPPLSPCLYEPADRLCGCCVVQGQLSMAKLQ